MALEGLADGPAEEELSTAMLTQTLVTHSARYAQLHCSMQRRPLPYLLTPPIGSLCRLLADSESCMLLDMICRCPVGPRDRQLVCIAMAGC